MLQQLSHSPGPAPDFFYVNSCAPSIWHAGAPAQHWTGPLACPWLLSGDARIGQERPYRRHDARRCQGAHPRRPNPRNPL